MEENNKVFKQNLDGKADEGLVFAVQLLMKEKCEMPDESKFSEILERHLGSVEIFSHSDEFTGVAVSEYKSECDGRIVSPMLMITGCIESDHENIDAMTRSQMWDCPEHEQILSECGHQVVVTEMLGGGLEAKERADMLMDIVEALLELYPSCEAVYFQNSGKMFTADKIRSNDLPREKRYIYFAVNVRFFRIQGTDDMMVDTLGMRVLWLPDLQYHFHGADPNEVVNHAYNMLSYIFENNCPIKNGDTIDGIENGRMSMNVQWKCHFEDALIQPPRDVIDVCMNEFASGQREY